ncbi:AbrB/MazE/SpoVT family DNA-binding domain-containing protein [Clostridium magnum]|uniref:AbrB/MazE/SpoVT family DNA-binding domain-containing protein n=1 Tax=Clostridium magnum TaxID=33954 RepID=UPI00091A9FDC|nr:AbrB/MazE/SpoVT family DNA-binding domain-containing protein [Clostridium magnum]SHJ28462.1 hypothetical protein SAMN02745944_05683 [Clostridium magnum DSM 2767]
MLLVKVQRSSSKTCAYVNLPKDIEKHLDLHKGDTLKFVIRDNGKVEIKKINE